MRFRIRFAALLAPFALLIAGTGVAVLMRNQIAESFIIHELASRNVAARLEVTDVDFGGIAIRNFNIEQLQITELNLVYTFRELLNGRIQVANIEGLQVNLDLTGENPPLGGLQQLFSERDTNVSAVSSQTLPQVRVSDAQINVLLPEREIRLDAFGDLQPTETGSVLSLSFNGASSPFLARGEVHAVLVGTTIERIAVDASLADDSGDIAFQLSAESEDVNFDQLEMRFRLDGKGDLGALAAHAALDEQHQVQSGDFLLSATGDFRFPANAERDTDQLRSNAIFDVTLSNVTVAEIEGAPEWAMEPFDASLNGNASLSNAALTSSVTAVLNYQDRETLFRLSAPRASLTLNDGYSIVDADLNEFSASATAVPTNFGTLGVLEFDGNFTSLLSEPTGTVRVRAASPAMTLDSVSVRGATLDANVTFVTTASGYRIELTTPSPFAFGTINLPAMLPTSNVRGRLLFARLDLNIGEGITSFTQTARIALPALQFRIERTDAPPATLDVALGPVGFEATGTVGEPVRFALNTVVESMAVPEGNLVAENATLTVSGTTSGNVRAHLSGGTISHAVNMPLFTELTPDVQITQSGSRFVVDGDLRGANDFLVIAVGGAHDLDNERGEMQFVVEELRFGPGGTTGEAVSPLFSSMQNLRGRIDGSANFTWNEEGIETRGRVAIASLSFRRNGTTFENVNADISLDRLLPARSLPSQHLTIGRIDVGIEEVSELEMYFKLDTTADGVPRILTESLGMNIAGGRIMSMGGTIDPATGDTDMTLVAENLNLADLLSRIQLEELTGEGALNGTIPIRLRQGGVSVEGASLRSSAPGVVAYRSERARQALSGGGDAVTLMLDALEDFHYNDLALALDKPVGGDTRVVLRLQGNNPEVLEGHPFDINISLTGDADPLLEAFFAGRQLSNDLLRSITGQ